MPQPPIISVCMITYNHEKYIEEAIHSVLIQDCNFEIELIIVNDCSLDNTDQLVQRIIHSHPRGHLIEYIRHTKNLGMMRNFIDAINKCRGKYIALCDGDDYWTDPLKLQKQVNFLETNPEYNICFHEVLIFHQEENKFSKENIILRDIPETSEINELAKGNFIHTPSVVLRNNFSIPNWLYKTPMGDWPLYMIVVKDKKIKKIPDTMAVYRVHKLGIWAMKTSEKRIIDTIRTYKLFISNNKINKNIEEIIKSTIKELRKDLPFNSNFFSRLLSK